MKCAGVQRDVSERVDTGVCPYIDKLASYRVLEKEHYTAQH
jgi:hypothetical protein